MSATRYDLAVDQGADLDLALQVWVDDIHSAVQDITSWTAKMEIRNSIGGTVLETLTVGSGITINGSAGQVYVHISAAKTTAYTWLVGVYDLFLYGIAGVPTKRPLFGDVTVRQQVTT
jgi:hypothetical protein